MIAPLLIILRAANRTALTSNTFASVRISEVKARTREGSTGDSGALPSGGLAASADEHEVNSGEVWIGVETTDFDPRQDRI